MPRIADYVVIQDGVIHLQAPPTAPGQLPIEFHSAAFSLPGVNVNQRAILAFRVNPSRNADIRLEVVLNDVSVVPNGLFNTDPDRSWHEVVSGAALRATGNRLDVLVQPGSTGTIRFSDIILWFQVDVP